MSTPQKKQQDAVALIEYVKRGFGCKTDSQLAEFLKIDPATISGVRKGTARLGIGTRLTLLDRLTFIKTRKLVERMLPENLAKAVERGNHAIVQMQVTPAESADGKILNLFKSRMGFRTDQELADFLDLGRSTISMVRRGRSGLGTIPKLRILAAVSQDVDFKQIEEALTSDDILLGLIEDEERRRGSLSLGV